MSAPESGTRRGYSWPPFEAGHERSTVHGARSPRHVEPRAAEIASALLAADSTPEHLRRPEFSAALAAWARAEAVVALLWEWLAEQDVESALSDVVTTNEDERRGKGFATRHTVSRRVTSVLDQLHRAETRAMNMRSKLGLDPASAGKLARDLSASRWYRRSTPLDAALDRIEAERRKAIGAAGSDA